MQWAVEFDVALCNPDSMSWLYSRAWTSALMSRSPAPAFQHVASEQTPIGGKLDDYRWKDVLDVQRRRDPADNSARNLCPSVAMTFHQLSWPVAERTLTPSHRRMRVFQRSSAASHSGGVTLPGIR